MKIKKKLNKIIGKHYWKNNQTVYITSFEVFDKDSCDLEIYLCDKSGKNLDTFLFEIRNYKAFYDLDVGIRPYNADRCIIIEIWDSVKASCSPYYFNRIFTIHKFTSLTKQDIENACKYFLHNILDDYLIFNISFIENHESLADKLLEDKHTHEKI